jgi:hypothetical protein
VTVITPGAGCSITSTATVSTTGVTGCLIAGALGGVGAGKASPNFDLGTIGNIISGLVGGGVLGQIVTLALPSVMAAAQSGNLSIGGIVSQVVAGGAGGAILTALIGAIKNKVAA